MFVLKMIHMHALQYKKYGLKHMTEFLSSTVPFDDREYHLKKPATVKY